MVFKWNAIDNNMESNMHKNRVISLVLKIHSNYTHEIITVNLNSYEQLFHHCTCMGLYYKGV